MIVLIIVVVYSTSIITGSRGRVATTLLEGKKPDIFRVERGRCWLLVTTTINVIIAHIYIYLLLRTVFQWRYLGFVIGEVDSSFHIIE